MEPVDVAPLVSEIVRQFREAPASHGREVQVEAGSALPQIAVDRQAFGLVVRNLLENAVKYAPGSAPVRVAIARDADGRRVTVRVRDEGPGIPLDEQPVVFDKFVRGAAARATGIRGTGVGLALARQIVRAHGGEISVESEVGVGSTFTVTLPEAPAAVARMASLRAKERPGVGAGPHAREER
jgi:signal transduction histidine kinase